MRTSFVVAHALGLALAGWAVLQLADARGAGDVLAWALAGLVLHDLVALPLYSLLDRAAIRLRLRGVAVVNHVRVPAVLAGVTMLVYFPTLLDRHDATFARVSGTDVEGALERWLVLTAAAFAVSALALLWRVQRLDGVAAGDDDAA